MFEHTAVASALLGTDRTETELNRSQKYGKFVILWNLRHQILAPYFRKKVIFNHFYGFSLVSELRKWWNVFGNFCGKRSTWWEKKLAPNFGSLEIRKDNLKTRSDFRHTIKMFLIITSRAIWICKNRFDETGCSLAPNGPPVVRFWVEGLKNFPSKDFFKRWPDSPPSL